MEVSVTSFYQSPCNNIHLGVNTFITILQVHLWKFKLDCIQQERKTKNLRKK